MSAEGEVCTVDRHNNQVGRCGKYSSRFAHPHNPVPGKKKLKERGEVLIWVYGRDVAHQGAEGLARGTALYMRLRVHISVSQEEKGGASA